MRCMHCALTQECTNVDDLTARGEYGNHGAATAVRCATAACLRGTERLIDSVVVCLEAVTQSAAER